MRRREIKRQKYIHPYQRWLCPLGPWYLYKMVTLNTLKKKSVIFETKARLLSIVTNAFKRSNYRFHSARAHLCLSYHLIYRYRGQEQEEGIWSCEAPSHPESGGPARISYFKLYIFIALDFSSRHKIRNFPEENTRDLNWPWLCCWIVWSNMKHSTNKHFKPLAGFLLQSTTFSRTF